MKEIVKKKLCTGCTACKNICPKNAIYMKRDVEGFLYPAIDHDKCINCGLCKKTCPILDSKEEKKEIEVYACYNKNNAERLKSSSGGIFILLAKKILEKKGVVFGASLNDNNIVMHTYVEKEEDLIKLMGSKYVQSDMNDSYKKVEEFLKNDKYVLFTGTPCQIEGLLAYLKKDYKKLYTQDIICHGVPSPLIWEMYKNMREKKDNNKPKIIEFRNKDNGWNLYNMKFSYSNNNFYSKNQNKDLFMKAFLSNLTLRNSCYNCSFKKKFRNSDITLADFWGIEKEIPELYDNIGTSVLVLNSSKGKKLFEEIKNEIAYKNSSFMQVVKYNTSWTNSVKKPQKRNEFFKEINNENFEKIIKKYTKVSLIKKVFRKIKSIIKK